jgi:dolichol-phosphate mannosyltransferase
VTTEGRINELVDSLKGPIVIFGASGFIGTNLMRTIVARRRDCFAVTHQAYVPWRLIGIPPENVLHADIKQAEDVQRLFSRYGFQTIFCLAAYGGFVRQSNALEIYSTNVIGLLNIIEAGAVSGFAALVHGGTQSEYGLNCAAPVEDARLKPNSHYAVSKVSASYLLEYYASCKNLPVINLRYYSIYGPFEDSDRLIAKVVAEGAQKRYPPFVDPDVSRDFVYVDDVVEATLLAARDGVAKAAGESINIASGRKTTIREVAATAKRVFGVEGDPRWSSMKNRFWDLKDWWGNPSRAKEVLGWQASTSFEEGLARTRDWYLAEGARPEIASLIKIEGPVRLSAIIACYRDAQAIPFMYARLKEVFEGLRVEYEIIFVNDASPDDAATVLAELAGKDEHVIVVEHSRNFGSQSAFLSGMEVSTGDAVILLDGDLQDPPELIPQFFEQWKQGFEVVYGRRVTRDASLLMRVCYKAFYRLFRVLSYVPIPLDAGDFSLMDKKVVRELLALPETDQFLRGLRAWVGFKQTGVDYERPERMFGQSTNNLRSNLRWARKAIFSFSFVPLEMMLYFGIALTSVAFALGVAQVIAKLSNAEVPHGISTIIVLILFFGGVQVLGIAVLGEYLGKIFEETKKRPKYIRRALTMGGRAVKDAAQIERAVSSRRSAA